MADKTSERVTILDHIEGFSISGEPFREPVNEYWALICLWEGMEFLYRQARRADETVLSRLPKNEKLFSFGNFPVYDDLPKALLTTSFHWYAVSACNYVRTVGAIVYGEGLSEELPQDYAKRVIPDVTAFRDKVAAHFAWASKNKHDNNAERAASVIPPLSFADDSFYVGGLTLSLRQGKNSSTSRAISPWSLTKVHEELRKRYWPVLESSRSSSVDASEAQNSPP